MPHHKKHLIAFNIGVFVVLCAITLYIQNSLYWYFFMPIGLWLFFDGLAYFKTGTSTLNLFFRKNYSAFFKYYLSLLTLGFVFEALGWIFKLWDYKLYTYKAKNLIDLSDGAFALLILTGFSIYPFILMHFKELYVLINSYIKNKLMATIAAMLIGVAIWEIPNIFTKDWTYTIPFIKTEIFDVNVMVILSWVFLITVPYAVYNWKALKIEK